MPRLLVNVSAADISFTPPSYFGRDRLVFVKHGFVVLLLSQRLRSFELNILINRPDYTSNESEEKCLFLR